MLNLATEVKLAPVVSKPPKAGRMDEQKGVSEAFRAAQV